MAVLTDTRLSTLSRVVYSFLAGCAFDGPVVRIGQRFIAESVGYGKTAIGRSLRELEKAGHIEAMAGVKGYRTTYELKSPVYSYTRARRYAGGLSSTARASRAFATIDDSDLIQ